MTALVSETIPPLPLTADDPHALPAESSGLLRIFARNSVWLWMDLGGLRIGSLLAGLFLIRYFGPANFGVYSSALAIGWVANAVTDLGVTRYAAREVASRPAERPRVIGVSLLTTLLALLMQGALVILAFLTGHEILACISGGLIYCNLEGTASFCSAVLTAELRSRDIVLSSITGVLGMVGMTILVVLLHLSVLVMLLGLCVKSVIVLSMRLWKLRSTWPTWETLGSSQLLRVIRNAWPYFKYNLTQIGYGRVAIVCFGLVASPEMVGWFAAAFTISDVFPQWSYACSNALLPLWTKLFESGRAHDLVELRQRLLDIVIFLSVPFWIGLAVFAPQVCRIFGPRFAFSAPVLRIVASRSLLAVLDGFLGHGYLIAVNQVQERQRAQSRSLVVLAVLSLLLGWLWGPVGVGVALFISDSTLILQYLRICSRVGMKIEWPALLPAGFAGAVMIAAVFATPNSLALPFEVVLVICAYFLSLFALSKDRFLSAGRTLRECVG